MSQPEIVPSDAMSSPFAFDGSQPFVADEKAGDDKGKPSASVLISDVLGGWKSAGKETLQMTSSIAKSLRTGTAIHLSLDQVYRMPATSLGLNARNYVSSRAYEAASPFSGIALALHADHKRKYDLHGHHSAIHWNSDLLNCNRNGRRTGFWSPLLPQRPKQNRVLSHGECMTKW